MAPVSDSNRQLGPENAAMDRVERLVRTWVASGRPEEVQETVSAISAGQASLLDVVKALGEYLTAEEDELRSKGVEFLAQVIAQCPSERMNRQAVKVLVLFMCSKLEDTETIIPALKGLVSLVTQPAFTSVDAVDVVKAMFAHVKMRVLVQSQRFMVYTIIDSLVAKHREAFLNMGDAFLDGYISLAEGEKDPRNLLVAFAIARVLLIEFDIKHHVEALFNITFCYFPITFRPPPDDPYGITSEDLKKALRGCLNATPEFGPLAVPLFLEKITAGSPATKRDTLQTLDACLPVYGASVAREHARKLWNTLKLEIFQPTDPETESMALHTVQVLIQTIYSGTGAETSEDDDIQGLARDACEECIRILKEPEKSQAKPAMKVLCAFVSTTPSVAKFTLAQAVPHLVKLFHDPAEAPNRAPVLRLLADLADAARASTLADGAALAPYKDELLGMLTVGLRVPGGAVHALDGLAAAVRTPGLLGDDERGFAVHSVNALLGGDVAEMGEDVSDKILALLGAVSALAPAHVAETTLPLLFGALPAAAPARADDAARLTVWTTLAFLKRLCMQADLFGTLVARLTATLDALCVPPAPAPAGPAEDRDAEDAEPTAAYAHALLRTLADALAAKVARGDGDVPAYTARLLPALFNLHVYAALAHGGADSVASDPRLVAVSAEVVTLVLQTADVPTQEEFVRALFAAYLDGQLQGIAEGRHQFPEGRTFAPFAPDASGLQKNLVLLFSAAVVALHKEVALAVPDESAFVDTLLQWGIFHADSKHQSDAAEHAVAAVLNKRTEGFQAFLTQKLESSWLAQAKDVTLALPVRRRVITAWTWMTKALQVRGHPSAQAFTDRLIELFDDNDVGWDAARAIGQVVSSDKVLTKKHHAVIKFLYAQKFANVMLPRIIDGAKTASDPRRQNAYLVALTSLIRSIPKTAYLHALPALMPLLLRGLDLPDAEMRANAIDTLLAVADPESTASCALVAEHASSLVATMLKNSMVQQMPSARVRTAALKYLAVMPSLVKYDVLHPQKPTVLRELAKTLDDPKRAVRKEAVEARTNWFKYTG
ncbi:Dos2-interacting transcription regulator of RNA-Pol-II-domain-containing protein [Phanerochaete sordida]|uniref:MMS19 nucleotide excision repair protein n=1 Tax=Phanerochaete sordida TaxID=48140 RepID=A0A9P3GN56_9APHY|nr:Dos2-interacting transcription regulator of RNA-Pol-II-domain-containing protein [Phanerochaete sordida]